MKAYYKQKNHNNAYSYWKEAFNACPPYANQTMLIDGTSLLRTEIKESKDGGEKEKLINQLLILHDLRAEYFPKYSIVARNNISLDAINYIEDDKRLFDILCPIIAANKANINPVVLLFYLNAAVNLFHDNSISNEDINSVINTVNELATSIRPKTEQDYNTIMEIRQNIEKLLHTL